MMPTTESGVVTAMRASISNDIKTLQDATAAMVKAAPAATDRGWDPAQDQAAIDATKAAWKQARTAYEHIEGATAPDFPNIDFTIDARYDDFLSTNGGDDYLFDDMNVTGLHAAERILYADVIPERVVTFESTLMGYKAAAFPSSADEASDFRTKLLPKMVADAASLQSGWTPANINLGDAFGGLISLMNEQQEKVNKAATGEEESRYSQRTMTDLRDNLAGTEKIYKIFSSWLKTKTNATDPSMDGPTIDTKIMAGFATLEALYAETSGEAIPQPPDSWSAENPSDADLATDFGKLYSSIHAAVAHDDPNSIVYNMNQAATIFGFDQFSE